MTQDILNAMEDDEVNSISDTVSSYAVAQTVVDCYHELVADLSLPRLETVTRLESLSDVDHPNYLKMPENINKVTWIKYNGKDLKYASPREFIDLVFKRDTGVLVTDFDGVAFKVVTTEDPRYWTTFNDDYIITDSFNIGESSTLIESRSTAFVEKDYEFDLTDDAVPKLPSRLFPTLLSKSKARCFVNFKQVSNVKEDEAERRGLVRHQNDRHRAEGRTPFDRLPNYAKAGRTSQRSTSQRN